MINIIITYYIITRVYLSIFYLIYVSYTHLLSWHPIVWRQASSQKRTNLCWLTWILTNVFNILCIINICVPIAKFSVGYKILHTASYRTIIFFLIIIINFVRSRQNYLKLDIVFSELSVQSIKQQTSDDPSSLICKWYMLMKYIEGDRRKEWPILL